MNSDLEKSMYESNLFESTVSMMQNLADNDLLLIKVPHPANRDSKETRFLRNFASTFYALKNKEILKDKTAYDLLEKSYEKYHDIIEKI